MARPRSHSGVLFPKIFMDIEPDEEEIRLDLLLLKQRIGDYNKPLQYSKQIIIGDVRRAFLTETDPVTGQKWQALSYRALQVPREGILRRLETGSRLYRSMVNRFNYGVTKQGVYLNQARIPFYAAYHQQDENARGGGVTRISREAVIKEIKRLHGLGFARGEPTRLKQQAVENVKSEALFDRGGKGEIPQRRFLGPSQDAQNKMVGVFEEWAREAIIIYKRGNILVKRKV